MKQSFLLYMQECLQKVNNLVGDQKKEVRFGSWNAVEVSCVTLSDAQ